LDEGELLNEAYCYTRAGSRIKCSDGSSRDSIDEEGEEKRVDEVGPRSE